MNRDAAGALGLVGLLLGACSGPRPPLPAEPPPAATEPVLQALPPLEESCFGWIDGRRVYAVSRDAVVIADLEAARVLDVIARTDEAPLDCSAVTPAPGGLVAGGTVVALAPRAVWSIEVDGREVAPTRDRWAHVTGSPDGFSLTLGGPDREPVRVTIPRASAVFAPDGSTLAICGPEGVELRTADTGEVLRASGVLADGGCRFSGDGRVLVALGRERPVPSAPIVRATLLAGETLEPIGAPIEGVSAALVSRFGSPIVVGRSGERSGFSVLDFEDREEIAHVSLEAPPELALSGDDVVLVSGDDGGLFSLVHGTRLLAGPLDPRHVSRGGRLLRVSPDGAALEALDLHHRVSSRLNLPALGTLHLGPGGLVEGHARRHYLVDLGEPLDHPPRAPLGDCPDVGTPLLVEGATGWRRLLGPCLELDDGSTRAVSEALATGAGRYVAREDGGLVVRDASGVYLARLDGRFEVPGELGLTAERALRMEGGTLTAFDTSDGSVVGARRLGVGTWSISPAGQRVGFVGESEVSLVTLETMAWAASVAAVGPLSFRGWHGEEIVVDGAEELVVLGVDGARRATLPAGPRTIAVSDHFVWIERDGHIDVRDTASLTRVASLDGTLACVGARAAGVARNGRLVLVQAEAAGPLERGPIDLPVDGCRAVLGDVLGWTEGPRVLLVRASDGDRVTIEGLERNGRLELVVRRGPEVLGGPEERVVLRQPSLTAADMSPAPHVALTLAEWLTGGS